MTARAHDAGVFREYLPRIREFSDRGHGRRLGAWNPVCWCHLASGNRGSPGCGRADPSRPASVGHVSRSGGPYGMFPARVTGCPRTWVPDPSPTPNPGSGSTVYRRRRRSVPTTGRQVPPLGRRIRWDGSRPDTRTAPQHPGNQPRCLPGRYPARPADRAETTRPPSPARPSHAVRWAEHSAGGRYLPPRMAQPGSALPCPAWLGSISSPTAVAPDGAIGSESPGAGAAGRLAGVGTPGPGWGPRSSGSDLRPGPDRVSGSDLHGRRCGG